MKQKQFTFGIYICGSNEIERNFSLNKCIHSNEIEAFYFLHVYRKSNEVGQTYSMNQCMHSNEMEAIYFLHIYPKSKGFTL